MTVEEVYKKYQNKTYGFIGGKKLSALVGRDMICTKFDFLARIEDQQVVAIHKYLPYAFLHVIIERKESAAVAVRHSLDFRNAWFIRNYVLGDLWTYECFVKFKKASGVKRIFGGIFPHMEFTVFNSGRYDWLGDSGMRETALKEQPLLRLYGAEQFVSDELKDQLGD